MMERILVVPRNALFSERQFKGYLPLKEYDFLSAIRKYGFFAERTAELEKNPDLKQIIPYQIFTFNNRFFLYQRVSSQMEKRLLEKFSLGTGGHINTEMQDITDAIEAGRRQELAEEVDYESRYRTKIVGFLNLEHGIHAVHFGIVYLLQGSSPRIHMKEKYNKTIGLLSIRDLQTYYENMEDWSKLVLENVGDFLPQK